MVNMIELSRHFELQIKALHAADENAQRLRQAAAVGHDRLSHPLSNRGQLTWNPHCGPPRPDSMRSRPR